MIKITEVVKSKQGSYRVLLSDKRELVVTEKTLLNHHLYQGKQLEPNEIDYLIKEGRTDVYIAKAMRYINLKMRSEQEIIDYLKKDELTYKDISGILNILKKDGYVDDALLSKLLVEEWVTFGLNGPLLIRKNLSKKGISKQLIEEALCSYTQKVQASRIVEDLEKTTKYPIRKSYYKALQSLQAKYARKGFSFMLIQNVFNAYAELVNNCIDEYSELKKAMYKLKQKEIEGYQLKQQLLKLGFSQSAIDSYNEEDKNE